MRCEWKQVKLGDVATVKGGKRLPKNVNLINTPNTHPYIRVRDLNDRVTLELNDSFLYVDDETQKGISRYVVNSDDIVISIVGTIGLVAKIGKTLDGANLTENCVKITNLQNIDKEYLFYYLKSVFGQQEIMRGIVGAVQQKLPIKNIQEITIKCPELIEQKKIAAILFALDEKIAINRAINDNLEQQAVTIFKSWFVEYSPFDGIEPKEWETVNLEKITSLISRGIAPKYSDNSDQIVINQKCIRNHMIDLSQARTHTPKVINEKWLRFGDLLINSTGDGTLGRAAQVWFQPQNITVDSHVTVVRPAKENLIFYIGLWGVLHEREIESLHTGSTGQTELPKERVKALELHLPDNGTLDRFNTLIAPMAAAIVSMQNENNKLAILRDALLPKLMSGEIDVSAVQL